MSKNGILKKFLLDNNASDDVKKERFSIAYDVHEQFTEIRREILSTFLDSIISKIKADCQLYTEGWFIFRENDKNEKNFRCFAYKKSWISQTKKPLYNLYVNLDTTYKSYYGIAKHSEMSEGLDDIKKLLESKKYKVNTNEWWFAYQYLPDSFRFDKNFLMDIVIENSGEFKRWQDEATMAFRRVFDLLKEPSQGASLETQIDTAVLAHKNKHLYGEVQ